MSTFKSLKYWLILQYHRMMKIIHFPRRASWRFTPLTLVISVCLILTSLLCEPQGKVATIDEKKIFASFVTELGKRNLTDEQYKQITARFGTTYRQVLANHAQKNRLVILKKEDVLVSANDITGDIAARINQEMRGLS